MPSKPDSQVAHLTVQGSRATIKQGRLIVQSKGEQFGDIPLERIHSVVVHGNIDISSALLRELMWRITIQSYGVQAPDEFMDGRRRVVDQMV